jgi:hypothetical protein
MMPYPPTDFPPYPGDETLPRVPPNLRHLIRPGPSAVARCILPFGTCLVAGGAEQTIESQTLIMCKPLQLCLPHNIAHQLEVRDISMGNNSFFGSMGVIPGTSFCERRVIRKGEKPIDWPTFHPGMAARIKLFNKSAKEVRLYAYFIVIQAKP